MSTITSTTNLPTPTYARARLQLGMTGVGILVVLASVALLGNWPTRWLPTSAVPTGEAARALFGVFAIYALVQFPLDVFGGYVLPRRHGRSVGAPLTAVLSWVRGIGVQGVVVVGSALVMLAAATRGGPAAGWFVGVVGSVLLVALQAPIARLVGRFGVSLEAPADIAERVATVVGRHVPVRIWPASDEGFTGGWFGLPGRESLVLPARWMQGLAPDELAAIATRRAAVLASGARTRGVLAALGFNATGLLFAAWLPGAGFHSVAALVTTALGFTLWSFLGLLLLPSLSRAAVIAGDAAAARHGVAPDVLGRAITQLDRWQDDEPARAPVVETIFHPVASVSRRLAHLAADDVPPSGAWHVARVALFTSWATLGLLPRAVHCNVGRPHLWVALPAD